MESGNETLPDTLENLQQFESGILDNLDTGILDNLAVLRSRTWQLGHRKLGSWNLILAKKWAGIIPLTRSVDLDATHEIIPRPSYDQYDTLLNTKKKQI